MAVLQIAEIGHPILRQGATNVTREELASPATQQLIDDMIDTMHHAEGAGIAANQIFSSLAICVIEVQKNRRYPYKPPIPLTVLVNPTLELVDTETFPTNEGCLSSPLRGDLRRHLKVRVGAWDRDGYECEYEPAGLTAGTFQHEIDHLNGVLIIDRVEDPRTLSTWPMFERHHSAAFVERITEFANRIGS